MDDKEFFEFVTNSVCFENGHYVIRLPFKSESVTMPNNKKQAEQRLNSLCKTFEGNSEFHDSYKNCMDKIICNGYAQRVPTKNLHICIKTTDVCGTYHTMVCFILKRKKLRVVFDCAARFKLH